VGGVGLESVLGVRVGWGDCHYLLCCSCLLGLLEGDGEGIVVGVAGGHDGWQKSC
jgi:hypothetical protein